MTGLGQAARITAPTTGLLGSENETTIGQIWRNRPSATCGIARHAPIRPPGRATNGGRKVSLPATRVSKTETNPRAPAGAPRRDPDDFIAKTRRTAADFLSGGTPAAQSPTCGIAPRLIFRDIVFYRILNIVHPFRWCGPIRPYLPTPDRPKVATVGPAEHPVVHPSKRLGDRGGD